MHALLKLVQSKDDIKRLLEHFEARDIQLANREHGEALTADVVENGGFSVNYGGYGRKITLGKGKSFASKWEAITHEELFDSKKPFANVTVFLHESVPQLERDAVGAFVTKNGGVINPDSKADLWIHALNAREASTAITEEVVRADLNAVLEAFPRAAKALEKSLESAPTDKGGVAKKTKITPEQIAAFEEITALLADKDLAKINEGLRRARDLSEHLDRILDGLKVNDGELSEAGLYRQLGRESHRDFVIFNLLSMASDCSKAAELRASITKISIGNFGRSTLLPIIRGFDAVETLALVAVNTDKKYLSSDLIDEEFKIAKNFRSSPAMPSLKHLATSLSLQGLRAPRLKSLSLLYGADRHLSTGDIPTTVQQILFSEMSSLHDLSCLVDNDSIQRLWIDSCNELTDCSALATLSKLSHAVVKAPISIPPPAWPKSLIHLEIKGWNSVELGSLPLGLRHLSVGACKHLRDLASIEHCKEPFMDHALGSDLFLNENVVSSKADYHYTGELVWHQFESGNHGSAVSAAGYLDLSECSNLVSLNGIMRGMKLREIRLPSHELDVSALASIKEIIISVDLAIPIAAPPGNASEYRIVFTGLGEASLIDLIKALKHSMEIGVVQAKSLIENIPQVIWTGGCKKYGEAIVSSIAEVGGIAQMISDDHGSHKNDNSWASSLISTISPLPVLRLKIRECEELDDLGFLEPLYLKIISLDLGQVKKINNVLGILKMNNLESLKIKGSSDNPAMTQLKKSRFTSKGQIDALKLKFMAGT